MPLRWIAKPAPAVLPPSLEEPQIVLAAPGSVTPRSRIAQVLAAGSLLVVAGRPLAGRPLLALPPRAAANTFNVTNLNPSGGGSLPQAVHDANNHPGADIITFDPNLSGTIGLSESLRITDSVTIEGPGPGKLSVSGVNAHIVFYLIAPAGAITTTIAGLTIRDGLSSGNGGGIYSQGVDLTLDQVDLIDNASPQRGGGIDFGNNSNNVGLTIRNSLVSGNVGGEGGGVYVSQAPAGVTIENTHIFSNTAMSKSGGGGVYLYSPTSVLIEDSSLISNTTNSGSGGGLRLVGTQGGTTIIRRTTVSGNKAFNGGGIQFYKPGGDTLIEDTTIAGNTASHRGGGLEFYRTNAGTHTIRRTTISGNMAASGAGIYLGILTEPLLIDDSTVSENHASFNGGGVYIENVQPVTIQNSTIVSNSAASDGGGIENLGGVLPITDTIIARNAAPADRDITGTFQLRYDLVQVTGTAAITNAGGNLFGLDPLLGPLANNGGPTQTHLPARNSPVVNAGDPAFIEPPSTDQRGLPRVLGGRIDIGAVERVPELFLPTVQR